jgi:hypothetical protein
MALAPSPVPELGTTAISPLEPLLRAILGSICYVLLWCPVGVSECLICCDYRNVSSALQSYISETEKVKKEKKKEKASGT